MVFLNLQPEERVLGLHGLVVDARPSAPRCPCRRSAAWRSSAGRASPGGRSCTGRSRPARPPSPRCRPRRLPSRWPSSAAVFARHSSVGLVARPSTEPHRVHLSSLFAAGCAARPLRPPKAAPGTGRPIAPRALEFARPPSTVAVAFEAASVPVDLPNAAAVGDGPERGEQFRLDRRPVDEERVVQVHLEADRPAR